MERNQLRSVLLWNAGAAHAPPLDPCPLWLLARTIPWSGVSASGSWSLAGCFKVVRRASSPRPELPSPRSSTPGDEKGRGEPSLQLSPNTECGGDESVLPEAVPVETSLLGSDPWGRSSQEVAADVGEKLPCLYRKSTKKTEESTSAGPWRRKA